MAKGLKPLRNVKKKEIKEDKLVTTYFQARDYLEENQGNILKIGGGALLLIVLVTFWVTSKKDAEYDAAYQLSMAMTTSAQDEPLQVADKFSEIADRYEGTRAGDQALLYVAQMRKMGEQLEEALEAYENYIRRGSKDKYLYPAALAGKASCLEDLERFEEAAEAFNAAATTHKGLFLAPQYLMDAARCYRLSGDHEKSKTQYELIINNYPDSEFSTQAEQESKRI